MRPFDIRYSQDSIAPRFGNGMSLEKTYIDLRECHRTPDEIPTITVFKCPYTNNAIFTEDNRRLHVFKWYEKHMWWKEWEQITIPVLWKESSKATRTKLRKRVAVPCLIFLEDLCRDAHSAGLSLDMSTNQRFSKQPLHPLNVGNQQQKPGQISPRNHIFLRLLLSCGEVLPNTVPKL